MPHIPDPAIPALSAPPELPIALVVGLGNPGKEYEFTRHNVGFMIADRLARLAGTVFTKERKWRAEMAKTGDFILCKPLTYMNLSGEAVQSASSFYKIPPKRILVVLDDMALPLGKLRLRPSGSAGGHNGLRSMITQFGTPEIPRLRIGISAAEPGAAVDHVLGRFSDSEIALLEESITRAVSTIHCLREKGMQAAMNACN